jgi:hypothetical protein
VNRVVLVCGFVTFGLFVGAGCQSQPGAGLPEPVGERAAASATVPPGHPDIARPDGAGGNAAGVDRPLPAGTRNPMEDIMAFKARLEKNPQDLEALISLANANMIISRPEVAQELYLRALAINPNNLDLRTNLAIAYKYGGKPDEAFTELHKNLAIDPNNDSTLYNLGFLYLHDKQDRKKALEIWKKWLTLHPNAPAAADVSKEVARIETEMGKSAPSGRPRS